MVTCPREKFLGHEGSIRLHPTRGVICIGRNDTARIPQYHGEAMCDQNLEIFAEAIRAVQVPDAPWHCRFDLDC